MRLLGRRRRQPPPPHRRGDERSSAATRVCGADPQLKKILGEVAAGTWQPPADGVSLDPYQTLAAVLSCALHAPTFRDALLQAVRMGGDTDTVAVLTGGLLGARHTPEHVAAELPWNTIVQLPAADLLADIGEKLVSMRGIRQHARISKAIQSPLPRPRRAKRRR
jgi:ADP-ribosylglycohydrolase